MECWDAEGSFSAVFVSWLSCNPTIAALTLLSTMNAAPTSAGRCVMSVYAEICYTLFYTIRPDETIREGTNSIVLLLVLAPLR